MMLVDVVLAIIWTGVTAYAIFGGADFGAGILDLFAGSATRGREMRRQLEHSIGPVWEANHVWLIFVLVYLWTAFPTAFVSIMTTLYIPVMLAGLGIVMRGSAFAFRKWAPTLSKERVMGAAFAASSFVTPFFLGAVAGGVASGRVPPGNAAGNPWSSWLNPTSVLGGVLAIVACTYLAAVLVARDATRTGRAELASSFRQRALWAGFLSGAVALGGIFVLRIDAPTLYEGLTEPWGLAAIMLSAGAGVASLVAIARAHHHMSRVAAVDGHQCDHLGLGNRTVSMAASRDPDGRAGSGGGIGTDQLDHRVRRRRVYRRSSARVVAVTHGARHPWE